MSSGNDVYKQLLQERARKLEQKRLEELKSVAVLPPPRAGAPIAAVLASTLPRLSQPPASEMVRESVFSRLGQSRDVLTSQSRDVFAEAPSSPLPEERKRKTVPAKRKPKVNPKRIFMDQYALEHPNLANDPQRLLQEASSAFQKLSKEDLLRLQDEADRQQKADLLALQMQQWQTPSLPQKEPPAKKRRVAKPTQQPQTDFESNLAAILGLPSSSSSSSSSSSLSFQ